MRQRSEQNGLKELPFQVVSFLHTGHDEFLSSISSLRTSILERSLSAPRSNR